MKSLPPPSMSSSTATSATASSRSASTPPDAVTALAGNRALLQSYRDEFGYQLQNRYSSRIAQFQAQMQRAELAINTEQALRRTILSDAEYSSLPGQLSALRNRKFTLMANLDEVRAQLGTRVPTRVEGVMPTVSELMQGDETLRGYQARQDELNDLIRLQEIAGRGPEYRLVRSLTAERDLLDVKTKERLEALMNQDLTQLQGDPETELMRSLEKQYAQQLDNVEAELAQLLQKANQIASIEQTIASKQEIADLAREEIEKIRVEIDQVNQAVNILASGVKPKAPYNAGRAKQMAVLGGLGGTLLGLGIITLIGVLDSRLRHAGDAQMGMPGTRMLGILPTLPDNFADPDQAEKAAHAVHHIRTLLQISNRGTARVFSVTSPAAGSGKSSLCVAMGLSFAASESKTLVIDCDLVGAGLTRRVGAVVNRTVESILREDTVLTDEQIQEATRTARSRNISVKDALVELGLMTKKDLQRLNRRQADSSLGVLDACQGRPFSECVAKTGIDNFYVLPIGAAKPQDAGLLSPKALRSLISRAREEYDVVLIDTGPCLGSLEASMAAAEADATVLIVSRGDSRSMATRAVEHLESVGANVVGVVFNHALDTDLAQSSFASIVSQERRTDPAASLLTADPRRRGALRPARLGGRRLWHPQPIAQRQAPPGRSQRLVDQRPRTRLASRARPTP